MGATSLAGGRREAIDVAVVGAQEDVFLSASCIDGLIIAKICHGVKMTLLRRLGPLLRAGMPIGDAATSVRAGRVMGVVGATWRSAGHRKF
jgi:hypothetical protein